MPLHERSSILVIVTCLIAISLIFELLKHIIEHAADEDMKPIVEVLFKGISLPFSTLSPFAYLSLLFLLFFTSFYPNSLFQP